VPSLMLLLGKSNWWFPGWLDRVLPRIGVEHTEEEELIGAGAAAVDPAPPAVDPASPAVGPNPTGLSGGGGPTGV
jgi:putative drug exporter of the RND superfamily